MGTESSMNEGSNVATFPMQSAAPTSQVGQNLTLARYPIHWHLIGEGKGQYIKTAAIHDTYNRCVTVHGTHNVRVENNVTYNIVGHCFFLEDGIEHGNQFVRNLAPRHGLHGSQSRSNGGRANATGQGQEIDHVAAGGAGGRPGGFLPVRRSCSSRAASLA